MKKRWPIRLKITLWYTIMLLIVVAFTYLSIYFVGVKLGKKITKDNLVNTVERNYDQVKFDKGNLMLDQNFLKNSNDVFLGIYLDPKTLIYGENPAILTTSDVNFSNTTIHEIIENSRLSHLSKP